VRYARESVSRPKQTVPGAELPAKRPAAKSRAKKRRGTDSQRIPESQEWDRALVAMEGIDPSTCRARQ